MSDLPIVLPAYGEILLMFMASAILIADLFLPERLRSLTYWLSLATLAACFVVTVEVVRATGGQAAYTFGGMFVADLMANVLKLLTYAAVAVSLVYSRRYLAERGMLRGEFFVLALFATLGMAVMISANNMLAMYLGLELMSLCLYSMVALNRDSAASTEAAMKYFVLGALASGLLLYGMSMLYGATGTLDLTQMAQIIATRQANAVVLVFGLVFVVAGLSFKLGVVPFHMWIPDVYHGAPNAMTLFIGTAPKLAAFAMAIRMLVNGLIDLAIDW
ncbi:MAG TPA: NADH-quinone oxidoreductase subunit N, partial [Burkholderiales bacterium]|nr:NADH-quinone oxidoreductase subunit N [Burkholderiales bacterium]